MVDGQRDVEMLELDGFPRGGGIELHPRNLPGHNTNQNTSCCLQNNITARGEEEYSDKNATQESRNHRQAI